MNTTEALATVIRARYDLCGRPDRYPMEDSLAEYLLEHLPAKGIAVVELPEPLRCRVWPLVIGGETEFVTVLADDGSGDEDPIAISGIGGLSLTEARVLAAALLAAADLAERES